MHAVASRLLEPDVREPPASPFRTALRECSAEELALANLQEKREDECRYLLYEEEARRMGQRSTPSREEMIRWIQHPDERVPLHLIRRRRLRGEFTELRWLLLERLLREAEAEERVWTPLLDALSALGDWPGGSRYVEVGGREREISPYPAAKHLFLMEESGWTRREHPLEEWQELRSFQAPAWYRHLALYYRRWSREALEVMYPDPSYFSSLWEARHGGGARREYVRESVQRLFLAPGWSEDAQRAAQWLEEMKAEERASLLTPEILSAWLDRLVGGHCGVEGGILFRLLTDCPFLSEEELESLLGYAAHPEVRNPYAVYTTLARHPRAGPRLWRRLLEEPRALGEMELLLVGEERALADPVLRNRLLGTDNQQVARFLLLKAEPGEVIPLARRWVREEPVLVALVLDGLPEEYLSQVTRELVEPLLSSAEAEVRLAGIRIWGRREARSTSSLPSEETGPRLPRS